MKKLVIVSVICSLVLSLGLTGCGTSKTFQGGAIGAAAGGLIGGIIGKQSDNTALGAIIGAAIGGTAGALIGNYMDEQAAEIERDIAGAKVERVGEGIKITFDSGILFATNSSKLSQQAKNNIASLAVILNKYNDTNILVTGHTDATGSEEYNQKLSEKRANSVVDYSKLQGVSFNRFNIVGLGETEPIATNDTEWGRKENRRVEIAIFANDKLKDAAEKGLIKK
ncbi:MAG: OmpA family protein [Rhodothermaceae bacterium]